MEMCPQSSNALAAKIMLFGAFELLSLGLFQIEEMYVDKQATIQELKDAIIRHINLMEPQLYVSVIENFDPRIEKCRHLTDILFYT